MPVKIESPIQIEAAGNKPKLIEEFIGRVNSSTRSVSIARMKSPQGWEEPGQTPQVETKKGIVEVKANQAVIVKAGEWVRYRTSGSKGAEYIAVCIPAFSPDKVHRDVLQNT